LEDKVPLHRAGDRPIIDKTIIEMLYSNYPDGGQGKMWQNNISTFKGSSQRIESFRCPNIDHYIALPV
jgi:hypothetical protein